MKRTSRFIVAIVLALVLTCSLLVVVACGEEGYSVTVSSYNQEGGSVSVAPPSEGELYDNNEEVTVTVTLVDGYEVTSVTANDAPCTPTADGKYTFNITADTVVKVEIAKIPEYALTINAPKTGGTVNASPAAEGEYRRGETITVTATAAEGYLLSSFKVDGEEKLAELDAQGRYVFDIAKATVIDVQFVRLVTVNVSVSPAGHAELTVTDPTHNGKFAVGESVTVEVVPEEGYELGDVYVNGSLYEGSTQPLTIPVTDNGSGKMNVEVTLRQLSQVVLDSVSGSVELKGTYTLITDVEGKNPESYRVVYDKQAEAVLLETYQGSVLTYAHLGKNVSGTENIVTHSTATGAVVLTPTSNAFADVFNPFANLIGDDIAAGETEHTWTVTNEADRAAILFALTRLQGTPTSVTLTEEDLQVVSITIVTANGTFVLAVENSGTATVPADYLANYQANTTLAAALTNMASAENYTVTISGYYKNPYNLYYNPEQGIYWDAESDEGGIFRREDGSLWFFTYPDKQFVTGEEFYPAAIESRVGLAYLGAYFEGLTANGYDMLFNNLGGGVYEIRSIDCARDGTYINIPSALASYLVVEDGLIYDILGDGAISLRITLNEAGDGIAKVETICLIPYQGRLLIGEIALEFKNIGSTELPIEIPADKTKADITEKYRGYFVTDKGEHSLEINIGSVYLDGKVSSSVTCSDDELKFTVNEVEYTLTIAGTEYTLAGGELSKTIFYSCDWADLIGDYGYYWDEGFLQMHIYATKIVFEGPLSFTVNAADIEFGFGHTSQGEYFYQIDFTANGVPYMLQSPTTDDPSEPDSHIFYVFINGNTTSSYAVYRDLSAKGLHADYVGNYNTTVTSGASVISIFVEINEDSIYFADGGNVSRAIVFQAEDGLIGLNTNAGTVYLVDQKGVLYLCVARSGSLSPIAVLSKYTGNHIALAYCGLWVDDTRQLILQISYNQIVIGETSLPIQSITATETGYKFTLSKEKFELTLDEQGNLVLTLDSGSPLTLYKCDWIDLIATWQSGTPQGVLTSDITIRVSAHDIVVTIGEQSYPATNILWDYDNYSESLYFTANNQRYKLVREFDEEGHLASMCPLYKVGEDEEETFWLYVFDNTLLGTSNWSQFVDEKEGPVVPATYEGNGNDGHYKVEISATSITVTLPEQEPIVVDSGIIAVVSYNYLFGGDEIVFMFEHGGTTYYITVSISGEFVVLEIETGDETIKEVTLNKDGTEQTWTEEIGTWVGTAEDGTEYEIVITEDSITVKTNDSEAQPAEIEFYDDWQGFIITIGEDSYYLMFDHDEEGNLYAMLMDGDEFQVVLDRAEENIQP